MLQTLFYIPHEIFGLPVFGLGWALGAWIIVCVVWLVLLLRLPEGQKELFGAFPMMLIVAAMIAFLAPHLEVKGLKDELIGIPIRGYGMMMLTAIVVGVGLAAYRARRVGLDPELIFSLALWMCVVGVVGARLFYVVQKWNEQFASDSLSQTIGRILSFTEGGLVVFGSAIGALAALIAFCWYRKLPTLAIADLVAPSMMFGLAIGRIGCLLNGCCYGGYCEAPLGLSFPPPALVYHDQLVKGDLFGVTLAESDKSSRVLIESVRPGSAAEEAGVKPGEVLATINGIRVEGLDHAKAILSQMAREHQFGSPIELRINYHRPWPLPAISRPVHPTQIYSSLDALLLGLILWFFYPMRRRDGEVIALMLTLHPISRFLLEVVRVDEGDALGMPLTISQLVGFLFLAIAIALWIVIERKPRGSALPVFGGPTH